MRETFDKYKTEIELAGRIGSAVISVVTLFLLYITFNVYRDMLIISEKTLPLIERTLIVSSETAELNALTAQSSRVMFAAGTFPIFSNPKVYEEKNLLHFSISNSGDSFATIICYNMFVSISGRNFFRNMNLEGNCDSYNTVYMPVPVLDENGKIIRNDSIPVKVQRPSQPYSTYGNGNPSGTAPADPISSTPSERIMPGETLSFPITSSEIFKRVLAVNNLNELDVVVKKSLYRDNSTQMSAERNVLANLKIHWYDGLGNRNSSEYLIVRK